MKKVAVILVLLTATCVAWSQDVPKVELFGGYSYLNVNPSGATTGINTSGWEGAINYNLNSRIGIVGDVSGHYCCNGESIHNFMAGPQFSYRAEKYTAFIHGLVGGSHAVGLSETDTNVALAVGGGLDYNVKPSFAIRVAQLDYLATHFLGKWQNNFRGSAGIVFRWGKR